MSVLEELTAEQRQRLVEFKAKFGRTWKATLHNMWYTGDDIRQPQGHLLRQVRNNFADRMGDLDI